MKSPSETDALDEAIRRLQLKQKEELVLLKEQAHITYESLKPINLIKKTLHQVVASPEIKGNIASIVISLATGFLSKRAVMGTSTNPLKRVLGTMFQLGIANVVSKHSDSIKWMVEKILLRIINSRKNPDHAFSHNGNTQDDHMFI